MKIFLVVEETFFFHPEFIKDFLARTEDEIVGAVLVTKVRKKNDIEKYILEHFYFLKLSEIWKLGKNLIKFCILDKVDKKHCYTVKNVLKRFGVPFIKVKDNINTPDVLNYIRKTVPDIIISSQSLYFGDEILRIPQICCLNRHSGLLPRNGGLWPVFQAIRKGEKETGVSVHTMEKQIDAGIVLSQINVSIRAGETVWDVYKECFEKSADALLDALDKVRMRDYMPVVNGFAREYYTFPQKEHWKEFRMRGGKYV